MGNVLISEEKLNKVISDVEILIEDVVSLVDQDNVVKHRLAEVKENPSIGKSEEELDDYLRMRGVEIE
jgi:formate-dependent nitrite reductase cytochrome c552 subunit